LYEKYQYEEVVRQARNLRSREHVEIIILGRNETKEHVIKWIEAGRDVEGVAGFAVGRTIFWQPLSQYKEGRITREEAVRLIAGEYFEYYKIFTKQA
jgi:5-dehydro-2-deoxygluconokinase